MGLIVKAKCRKCKFKSEEMWAGQGEVRKNDWFWFPSIDLTDGELALYDHLAKEQLDGKVIFYDHPEMFKRNTNLPLADRLRNKLAKLVIRLFQKRWDGGRGELWGDLRLNDYIYKCPKCKMYAMKFENVGYWD